MTRDNKPEITAEKRIEYAYWATPNMDTVVTYSLPLFHEIDFAVNEGYRKIPHGGIEEGGLLFGKIDDKGTQIDAFRPIQCEHASGPSLVLSERDLDVLTAQLANVQTDPELAGLEPVGWFLAHTRGPLLLTDREAELCETYFTRRGMLTVLVKPERFQPTRFGFLVRGKEGGIPRDATQSAIILPLPGRIARSTAGPVASIPAPALSAATARRALEPDGRDNPPELAASASVGTRLAEAAPASVPITANEAGEELSQDRPPRRLRHLTLDQVVPEPEEAEEDEAIPAKPVSAAEASALVDAPAARRGPPESLRRAPRGAASSESALSLHRAPQDENATQLPDPYRQMELLDKKRPTSTAARFVMVLPLAALLGCVVGYVAYLQVPSPVIPLTVKGKGETVVVTWPADQTRSAVYAAVRVDDSTPVMLTPEERAAGRVEVTSSADMKVELIARNWIHDSRGIVRFIKPLANTAP
jgi:hypothetical protein